MPPTDTASTEATLTDPANVIGLYILVGMIAMVSAIVGGFITSRPRR